MELKLRNKNMLSFSTTCKNNSWLLRLVLVVILYISTTSGNEGIPSQAGTKPNIIFIMADDAGWNDFSFHGSAQIPTLNIDALAFSGMVLNSYYGSPLCTPTRGAVMTGKHPIHLRLQHYVIIGASAEGLPLDEKLMPEYLRELGYSTHLVGKWHLGHSKKVYTPTYRGFDSHYGYWLGKQDYYDHFSDDGGTWGYDFRSNMSVHFDAFGKYDTDLFTKEAVRLIKAQPKDKPLFLQLNHIAPHSANSQMPLQAPLETVDKFEARIKDPRRRIYAAVVDKLDESVGLVVEALKEEGRLQNSIIVFASDNGGAPDGFDLNYGSNWPLKGVKNTLWEGGTRLAALIWSPLIQNRVSFDLMHAMDWLPTVYEAAGGNISKLGNIDGLSMWQTFSQGEPSPRDTLLYNIDDNYNNSAVRSGNWKLIQGNTSTPDLGGGNWDNNYGPDGRDVEPVGNLIPRIMTSLTATSLSAANLTLNETAVRELQKKSEVLCNPDVPKWPCDPYSGPCLFNLQEDPCEYRNMADFNPSIVQQLLELLESYNRTALTPNRRFKEPLADPKNWGYVWTNWLDYKELGSEPNPTCGPLFFNFYGNSRTARSSGVLVACSWRCSFNLLLLSVIITVTSLCTF